MSFPSDFIDRDEEKAILEQFLEDAGDLRIMAFVVKELHGKTYLTLWFEGCCREHQLKVVRLDFDKRNKDVMTYWKFVSCARDALGVEHFPQVAACEMRHARGVPLVNLVTGAGDRGFRLGEKGRYEGAELSEITGGDRIHIEAQYFEAADSEEQRLKKQMHEMGRAFSIDLGNLASKERVVFIFDTFEQVTDETNKWISEWVLAYLGERYPRLYIMMAGRSRLNELLAVQAPWRALLQTYETFSAPTMEHVRDYVERQKLAVPEGSLDTFLTAAQYQMGILGQLRDVYRAMGNRRAGGANG